MTDSETATLTQAHKQCHSAPSLLRSIVDAARTCNEINTTRCIPSNPTLSPVNSLEQKHGTTDNPVPKAQRSAHEQESGPCNCSSVTFSSAPFWYTSHLIQAIDTARFCVCGERFVGRRRVDAGISEIEGNRRISKNLQRCAVQQWSRFTTEETRSHWCQRLGGVQTRQRPPPLFTRVRKWRWPLFVVLSSYLFVVGLHIRNVKILDGKISSHIVIGKFYISIVPSTVDPRRRRKFIIWLLQW